MFRQVIAAAALLLVSQGRPPDIAFRIHAIDPGASETAAVADINRDGRLDIVSGEFWYQAPGWTKHKFRELGFSSNYIDNFSDMPIDVDGDGYPDIASVSWFAKKIAWWQQPGQGAAGLGQEARRSTPASTSSSRCSPTSTTTARRTRSSRRRTAPAQAWYEVEERHVASTARRQRPAATATASAPATSTATGAPTS